LLTLRKLFFSNFILTAAIFGTFSFYFYDLDKKLTSAHVNAVIFFLNAQREPWVCFMIAIVGEKPPLMLETIFWCCIFNSS
jgi:hypothetical protein